MNIKLTNNRERDKLASRLPESYYISCVCVCIYIYIYIYILDSS